MFRTWGLVLALLVIFRSSLGEIIGDPSQCKNSTDSKKCFVSEEPSADENMTWTFNTNSTRKYFAIEIFNLHVNDTLWVYSGGSTNASSLTGNFSGKSDPFLVVTFTPVTTIVLKTSADEYKRSIRIDYNTNGCEVFMNQSSATVKAPIYRQTIGAEKLNCTYHINTGSTSGHVALSFDEVSITKGAVRVWDGKSRSADLVLDTTGKLRDSFIDIVSSNQDILMETILPPSKIESFSAHYITEDEDCGAGIIKLNGKYSLTSPGFPKNYANNMDCRWLVMAPEGYTIKLDFATVDLADTVDNILVNDGGAKSSYSLVNIHAGYKQKDLVMTSTSKLLIRFRTDDSLTGRGFNITLSPLAYGGSARNSGRVVLKKHKELDINPVYDVPNATIPSPPVYFLLEVPVGQQVKVEMNDSFFMPTSTIDFRDGANPNATLIGHYRSDKSSYPVVSNGNQMLIVVNGFYINGSMSRQYFIADFTSVIPGQQFNLAGDSGSASLREHDLNKTATYIIVNPSTDNIVSLEIHDLYLPHNSTISLYRGPSDQSIRFLQMTGTGDHEPTRSFPVIYTKEARIVYSLNSTDGVSPKQLLLSFSFQTIPGCDGLDLSSANGGSLLSPLYPNQYPVNAHCSWSFTPVQNMMLRLNFKDFTLSDGHTLTVEADHYHILPNSSTPAVSSEILRTLSGTPGDVPDMIISMNNNSINTTKVKLTFDATFKGNDSDLKVAQGFKVAYEHLACGGNLTDGTKTVQTPHFPSTVDADSLTCVWIIDLPTHPASDNTSVNIVNYQYNIKHFSDNTNTSTTHFEARYGASERSPMAVLVLKEGDSGAILSITNQLWISYTFNRTKGSKDKGFAVSLKYSTTVCGAKDLCDNGRCMHSDWKCNGIDECGDDSDERDCYHATNMVSRLVLGMAIVVTFIIAVALACVVPAVYKRMKYPNYSELRDLMTPVPT